MKKILFLMLAITLSLAACGGSSTDVSAQIGDIVIRDAWVRPAFVDDGNGAGYMIIENTGDSADTLISASAEFANMVQIHETVAMEEEGEDVMGMRQLENGITIPAGETVTLEVGGIHVMLMGIPERLEAGETVTLTLEFVGAGTVEVEAEVREE